MEMTKTKIRLTSKESKELQRRLTSRSIAAEEARRARIILLLAQGHSFGSIRGKLSCTDRTINTWEAALPCSETPRTGLALPRTRPSPPKCPAPGAHSCHAPPAPRRYHPLEHTPAGPPSGDQSLGHRPHLCQGRFATPLGASLHGGARTPAFKPKRPIL